MRVRSLGGIFIMVALVAGGATGAGCGSEEGGSGSECVFDTDCSEGFVCSAEGTCVSEETADTDNSTLPDGGTVPDGMSSPDGGSDTTTLPDGQPWPDDSRTPPVDSSGDPPPDVGPDRALSCHEFATCSFVACAQFDYSCRKKYSNRTPDQQLSQLSDRQNCADDDCAGLEGEERVECIAANCETEWQQCAERPGSGPDLDCGEFHACVHLCNGKEDRQNCLADCRSRATDSAQAGLQAYQQCVAAACEGTEGRDRLECTRNNCFEELSQCWAC